MNTTHERLGSDKLAQELEQRMIRDGLKEDPAAIAEREREQEEATRKRVEEANARYIEKFGEIRLDPERPFVTREESNRADESDYLTIARQHYFAKETPQGDQAAAKWLIDSRSVKTDASGKIHAYNKSKGHYEREGEALLKADLIRVFGPIANRTRVGEILAKVAALSYTPEEILQATTPPNLIPLMNGVYDRQSGKLLPHSPEYFFTYVHPLWYDKNATCPTIRQFLNTSVTSEEDREVLLDIVALCLYRARVTRNFYVLVGGGHNGKSLFLVTLRAFLGKARVVSLTPQALAQDIFAPAQLYNKHANLGADIPGGIISDTAIVKAVTGGDPINVQRKGVDREDKEVYCEFVWASNDPPRITEDTHAIWDRIVVVKFPYTFVAEPQKENERQAVIGLEAKMTTMEELSGLLNLAIERLPRLIETRALTVKHDPVATRKAYRTLSDTPAVFIDEMCEEVEYEPYEPPHTQASGYVTAEEMYREYKQWCKSNKVVPVSANKFGRAVEALGFEKGKDNQVRTYRGLEIRRTGRTDRTDIPYSTRMCGLSKEENREKTVQSVISVLAEDTLPLPTERDQMLQWVIAAGPEGRDITEARDKWPQHTETALRSGDVFEIAGRIRINRG